MRKMFDTHSMNLADQGIAIGNNSCVIYTCGSNDESELSNDLMVSGCSDYSKRITQYRESEDQ